MSCSIVARLWWVCCPTLLLVACAAPRPSPLMTDATPGVRVVSAQEVSQCSALPTVVATNAQTVMENGMLAAQSFGSARAAVMVKAQAEGATHLVWGDEIVGGAGSFVTARPYRCDRLAAK